MMKRIFTKIGIILSIITITILGGIGIFEVLAAAAPQNTTPTTTNVIIATTSTSPIVINSDQQIILDQFTTNLKNEGVPVKSVQIDNDSNWNPADVISVKLQSTSQNSKVSPEDPIYLNLVGHEANLAKQQGLIIGAIHTILLNNNGGIIYDVYTATNNSDQIALGFSQSSVMSNEAIESSFKNFSFSGITGNAVNVTSTEDGQHLAVFNMIDQNLATADIDCKSVVNNIGASITNLNLSQESHIAVYEIRVVDANGNPLFNYISDIQFGRITWWQSDTIAKLNLP
jgi:hypothetical protein